MKRWVVVFFLLGIFFFTALALITSEVRFPLILPTGHPLNSRFYDYSGITHVHSAMSTGSGQLADIARAAYRARCSFVIITDLNPTTNLRKFEGYHSEVLVMWAGEYSFLGGHLLAYDVKELHQSKGLGQNQIFFNDLLEKSPRPAKNGFVVAAHPFLQEHSWENFNSPGLSGMEILNLDDIWHEQFAQHKLSLFWSFVIMPFNSDLSYLRLYTEPHRELAQWDEILAKRPFLGFGGSDATANAIPVPEKSFSFPSYYQSFKLMKDHVLLRSELTGTYDEDRAKIMEALGRGSFYFSLDLIGNPAGFYFLAQQRHGESLPGATLNLNNGPISLIVDLGRDIGVPHEIELYRNGVKVDSSNTDRLAYDVKQPGAFRAVVKVAPTLPLPDGKTWFTWIFTNAIRAE